MFLFVWLVAVVDHAATVFVVDSAAIVFVVASAAVVVACSFGSFFGEYTYLQIFFSFGIHVRSSNLIITSPPPPPPPTHTHTHITSTTDRCTPLTLPNNLMSSSLSTYPGTRVNFTCTNPLVLHGPPAIVCLSGGHWSSSVPSCSQRQCSSVCLGRVCVWVKGFCKYICLYMTDLLIVSMVLRGAYFRRTVPVPVPFFPPACMYDAIIGHFV